MSFLGFIFHQQPAGLVVSWVIVAVFLAGLGEILWKRLRRNLEERNAIGKAREMCRTIQDSNENIHDPSSLHKHLQDEVPQGTLAAQWINDVYTLRKHRGRFPLLGGHVDPNMLGRLHLSQPNILILLGLLGTLIGLVQSIQHIASRLQAPMTDVATWVHETRTGLAEIIEGMRTAFSTTLVGLVGSVVLSIVLIAYRRHRQDLVREARSFITEYLAPCFFPSEDRSVSDVYRGFASSASALEQLSRKLGDSYTKWDQQVGQLNQILSHFNDIVDRVGTDNRNTAEVVAQFERLAKGSQQTVDKALEMLSEERRVLATTLEDGIEKLGRRDDHLLDELKRGQQDALDRIEQHQDALLKGVEAHEKELFEDIRARTVDSREMAALLRDIHEQGTRRIEADETLVQSLRTTVEETQKQGLTQHREGMDVMKDAIEELARRHDQMLDRLKLGQQDALDRIEGHQNRLIEDMQAHQKELLEDIRARTVDSQEMALLLRDIHEQGARRIEADQILAQSLRAALEETQKQGTASLSQHGEVMDTIETLAKDQRLLLEGLRGLQHLGEIPRFTRSLKELGESLASLAEEARARLRRRHWWQFWKRAGYGEA